MKTWQQLLRSGMICVCVLLLPSLLTAQEQRHVSAHILRNERLFVEVMDPQAKEPYYKGVRFSPVANVLRVVMDGHDFLFSPLEHDPIHDNAGLAMDFDLFQEPFGPPGFQEAEQGGEFLKVGVGILKKSSRQYSHPASYAVIELAQTDVTWKEDSASFRQTSRGTNGYAYALEVDMRLSGVELVLSYRLANTGTKELSTEQYTHNFFCFDEKAGGAGYEVEFPYDFELKASKPLAEKKNRILFYNGEITPAIRSVDAHITPQDTSRRSDGVIVRNAGAGMEIEALLSVPASRITVHAGPCYVCPEQFLALKLQPGDVREWVRSYRFKITAN